MKLSKGSPNLDLPDYIKFGLELEVENLDFNQITPLVGSQNWSTIKDASLVDGGTECVSPVLQERDDSSVWDQVQQICDHIKTCPTDPSKPPYTDQTCGGHIHFDAGVFAKNPEVMKNFLRLWAESEETVFKMCNAKGDPIRQSAMEKAHVTLIDIAKALVANPLPKNMQITSIKDCINICRSTGKNMLTNMQNGFNNYVRLVNASAIGTGKRGMAYPRGQELLEKLESGKLKIGQPKSKIFTAASRVFDKIETFGTLGEKFADLRRDINKSTVERYAGLNLHNIGDSHKNTIEFRMSNGTIDPDTIKENVFLYASLIKTAVDMTEHPEQMQDKIAAFYNRDVSEEEKVDAFLGLIMDAPEDRQVYKDRWESVKDDPVFAQTQGVKRFTDGTYQLSDFQKEARKPRAHQKIAEILKYIADMKAKANAKTNFIGKEDEAYVR